MVQSLRRWQYGHLAGNLRRASVALAKDNAHLLRIIEKIVSRVGRRVDESSPLVDARLPDGSRVNVAIPPVAVDGPLLSIRPFGKNLMPLCRRTVANPIAANIRVVIRSLLMCAITRLVYAARFFRRRQMICRARPPHIKGGLRTAIRFGSGRGATELFEGPCRICKLDSKKGGGMTVAKNPGRFAGLLYSRRAACFNRSRASASTPAMLYSRTRRCAFVAGCSAAKSWQLNRAFSSMRLPRT